jgi:membrane protease YdiL (CAAX protease family)
MNKTIQKPLIKHGWVRAVVYFICALLIVFLFSFVGSLVADAFVVGTEKGADNILQFGIVYLIMGAGVFLITWIFRKFVDRESFESLGFGLKNRQQEAAIGFFSASALLGIGSLILIAAGFLNVYPGTFDPGRFMFQLVLMVAVTFIEEVMFRGYLLNNLMQSTSRWIALVISAVLFAVFHSTNPGITFLSTLNIFLAGIFLGLNYIYTKNLWFSIVFHFAWNFLQGPVLGYEVSGLQVSSLLQQSLSGPELWTGGRFGFEGSLLCPLLFAVAIPLYTLAFNRRYQ